MLYMLNDMMDRVLDGTYGSGEGILLALAYYFLMFAFGVVSYVLMSIGMYRLAKSRWIRNPWLAWIPLGNLWILGSVSDQYRYVVKNEVNHRRKMLLGLGIAASVVITAFYGLVFFRVLMQMQSNAVVYYTPAMGVVLLAISVLMVTLIIWLTVEMYAAFYDLYISCDPENGVMFLVLSIVFSVTMPFFVFACRNKEGGMPPRKAEYTAKPVVPEEEPVLEVPQEEATPEEAFEAVDTE